MPSHPSSTPDVEAEAQRLKTALLYRNAGTAQMVNVVNASLLAYVNVTLDASTITAFLWWLMVIVIAAGRYFLARRFFAAAPDATAAMTWRNRYIAATTMAAATWGVGTVLFIWNAPDEARLFTGLVLSGMVAGAVPLLAPVPAAFRIFALLVCLPMSAAIFIQANSALHWAFGSMTLVFLAAVLFSARYLHETLDGAIRLGLEKGRIVENLEHLRAAAETALAERKQAVATLQASEERYRLILQHSPTGIVQYNSHLVIVFCNQRFADILKAPHEKLIGLDMQTLKDQRVLSALRAPVDGKVGAYEGEYISTLSGVKVWANMTCTPLYGIHGGNDGGIAFIDDISERKRIESGLQQSEQKLRAITDNVSSVMFLKDLTGRYLYVNRQFEKLFHVSNDMIQGKTDHDILPPAMAETLVRNDHIVIQSGQSIEVEEQVPQDDGLHTYVSVKLPIRDVAGEIYAVCGISTDITDRKRAEADLRIAASAFESQEGMIITDAQSVILRVNVAFTESTGYSAEDLVGQTPRMLQSGRHNADFFRVMWETIHRTGGWQGEIWDRRKNGEVYPKWLTISSVKGDDGSVTNYIGTHYDITERKKAEEKIAELAFFDPLTRLPNRTLLLDRLKQTMTAGNRAGTFGALLFIDLDHFKTLNDTLGHDKGDLLLQQVAQRLAACVREGDTVARLGGDEFVVVLENLHQSSDEAATQTKSVGEIIHAALNQPYQLGAVEHRSTASIGATLFCGHETPIDDLLKQADLAMYKAKETGRNALRFFDPAMQTVVLDRAALEKSLRQAIHEHQFVLHYQAQVVGEGSRVTGAEVLVRWVHPERGIVPPTDFIPLAEETGLILPLGHWVLKTACTRLATWASQPAMADLTVAVNVSPHQFREHDFVAQVLTILDQTGANPNRLKLELTEGLLVNNVQDIIEKMYALKTRGVGFSLDDFGIGYSSLSYLKRMPLDQLKIDQSFVRDVLIDPNDAAIARTIVALAQSLGLEVMAEGVETPAQRDFLANAGCQAYQGYLFSRPVPVEDFEAFVLQHQRLAAVGLKQPQITLI